ncbi:HDOD domain-containing protein [Dethiosulfatarculus sandiegensis]|uniref:HDOD domain-containing protein n=1 Tax=Dethiosulfatarculus sandiegensis TaxID=1429043 RepID=UPI0005C8E816|nr:HDOD domain-containing protein [Dethiosulfatarculus sandiegensis]
MSLIKRILKQVDHLPGVPAVLQQVLSLVNDPEFSFEELVEVVRVDPGITAHVLKVCNSPYYGLTRKVSSLQQAMTYLGVNKVVDIILTSEVVSYYKNDQTGYRLKGGELWRHSVAVALLAQEMGKQYGYKDLSTLFTAGLLHDVGKLILSEFVEEEFKEILRLVKEEGMSFPEAERKVLGVDHALLGAKVVRSWNFPEPIIRAIAYHHDFSQTNKDRKLVALVNLANLVVLSMGIGGGAQGLAVRMPQALMDELGLKARDLDDHLLAVKDIGEKAEELLSMAN